MDAGRVGHEFVVSAWPEQLSDRLAGVCDGVEALALGGAIVETTGAEATAGSTGCFQSVKKSPGESRGFSLPISDFTSFR
jgi:hypothetical protein